jgi:hypothetical protein
MKAMTDWTAWQKCPVCPAGLGEPCLSLSGRGPDGTQVRIHAPRPHEGRRPRTRAAKRPAPVET